MLKCSNAQMLKGALISSCKEYRYHLWRYWDDRPDSPALPFIMLNPSTADATEDDPTIRRCIGFAKRLGFGGIDIVNLFAFRATNPAELHSTIDPVGPDNDVWVSNVVAKAINYGAPVVCAWGTHGRWAAPQMVTKLETIGVRSIALGVTKDGHPRHPLYLPNDTQAIDYPQRTLT